MSVRLRRTPAMRAVLKALEGMEEPAWGLLVARSTGLPTGTVYPLLRRFEETGLVVSEWESSPRAGARRRLYELSDEGRSLARRVRVESAAARAARDASGATGVAVGRGTWA